MRLKYTTFEVILELICFVFIGISFAYIFIMLEELPQQMVTHFDSAGVPDRWGDKDEIFNIPLMGLMIYLFATILTFFPKRWNVGIDLTHKNAEKVYRYTRDMIIVIKTEITICFFYVVIISANQVPMNRIFLWIVIIGLFGTIIYYMGRISVAKKEGIDLEERTMWPKL